MRPLSVLIACEYSGRVRDAFRALGHNAVSCDLLPTERPGFHYWGDVRDILRMAWDVLIAHPPCTYLTVAGLHWNKRGRMVDGRPRAELTEEALDFVRLLMGQEHIPAIVVENPVSCISSRIRKPDQIVQPWMFGEDASKATCLWLKGVDPLPIDPAQRFAGRLVEHKGKLVERWGNQTDSGQNRLSPSEDRWKDRSRTYNGIATAMAKTWGGAVAIAGYGRIAA